MLLVRQPFFLSLSWEKSFRAFPPSDSMWRLLSLKIASSMFGTLAVRTKSDPCGSITTKMLRVSFLWSTLPIETDFQRPKRSSLRCWLKKILKTLFYLWWLINKTLPLWMSKRSKKLLICPVLRTDHGTVKELLQLMDMDWQRVLRGYTRNYRAESDN